MNYFKFHIGDYASATRHLSWDEDMGYRRLLDAYYMREAPLPLDMRQVYRLTMAVSKVQRQAIDAVLAEFFIKNESGFINNRCEEELASFTAKRESAKASADEKWRRARAGKTQSDGNANSSPNADANDMRTQSDGNAPTNHKPEEEKETLSGFQKEGEVLPPKPERKAERGTRLSDDFEPDESCHAVVEELLLTRQQSQQAFDNFRDYWRAKPGANGCKLDWQATFRIWLRKEKFNGQGPSRGPRTIDDKWDEFDVAMAGPRRCENSGHEAAGAPDASGLPGLREGLDKLPAGDNRMGFQPEPGRTRRVG